MDMENRGVLIPPGLMLYRNEFRLLQECLSVEELGSLVIALMDYSETGVIPDATEHRFGVAFSFMAAAVDRDREAYRKKVESSHKAARARWDKVRAAEALLAQSESGEAKTPSETETDRLLRRLNTTGKLG